MAALGNKMELLAVSRESPEEYLGHNLSRDKKIFLDFLRSKYNTQISEDVEGRVTKKLLQEFSRTESRILGALSKIDEFLLNS